MPDDTTTSDLPGGGTLKAKPGGDSKTEHGDDSKPEQGGDDLKTEAQGGDGLGGIPRVLHSAVKLRRDKTPSELSDDLVMEEIRQSIIDLSQGDYSKTEPRANSKTELGGANWTTKPCGNNSKTEQGGVNSKMKPRGANSNTESGVADFKSYLPVLHSTVDRSRDDTEETDLEEDRFDTDAPEWLAVMLRQSERLANCNRPTYWPSDDDSKLEFLQDYFRINLCHNMHPKTKDQETKSGNDFRTKRETDTIKVERSQEDYLMTMPKHDEFKTKRDGDDAEAILKVMQFNMDLLDDHLKTKSGDDLESKELGDALKSSESVEDDFTTEPEDDSDTKSVYAGCVGLNSPFVKLISSDGHVFIMTRAAAYMSKTLEEMLFVADSSTEESVVYLLHASSQVLQTACKYLEYKLFYNDWDSGSIPVFPIAPEEMLELLLLSNFLRC